MLNRDQTIGHAYFIKVDSFEKLAQVLTQQIVPLLQEYFYEDWQRIQLVFKDLKDGDVSNGEQVVRHTDFSEVDTLGFDHEEFEDTKKYSVVSASEVTAAMLKKVYE